MGSSTNVWVLHAKEHILDQNFKSLWVPDLICGFEMHNCVINTRLKRLYWFQPSSVFVFMQNSDFMTKLTSLYGSHTSSVVLSTHNSVLSTRINRAYWFHPSPVVLCMQNNDFRTRFTSLCGSKTPHVVFACKTVTSGPE